MDQPVVAVCGDSTFFHAVMPALVDAVHNQSDVTLVVLDNSGTAMTGFQPHPGLTVNAMGEASPPVDIAEICRAVGAEVAQCDPFDVQTTENTLTAMLKRQGARVVILKQICALSPEKRGKKKYEMSVREDLCLGEKCGCNRMCTRILRCPGIYWDADHKVARIDEVICAGCGVCANVCPTGAIQKVEVA
jgi:indolepyruvate ferredoxin oxidoreductase alpha subunit